MILREILQEMIDGVFIRKHIANAEVFVSDEFRKHVVISGRSCINGKRVDKHTYDIFVELISTLLNGLQRVGDGDRLEYSDKELNHARYIIEGVKDLSSLTEEEKQEYVRENAYLICGYLTPDWQHEFYVIQQLIDKVEAYGYLNDTDLRVDKFLYSMKDNKPKRKMRNR